MSGNDAIILDSTVRQKKEEMGNELEEGSFFEIFTFEQILKDYEVSYEDIDYGKVGDGDDGGIDGFFFFINKELIKETIDPNDFKQRPKLDLFIIQSKRSPTFSESIFQKINTTIQDIFDLKKNIETLRSFYNESLVERARIFRESYLSLASKHPSLELHYFYASREGIDDISPKVYNEAKLTSDITLKYFSGSKTNIKFLGARELLGLSRIEKSYTLSLNFIENILSKGENNYLLLANLMDYYKFVTNTDSTIRSYIFDSNVRDFQGSVEVNMDMMKTLLFEKKLDFWWLNNGVTILASNATVTGKTITLDDVQIINGLQTTNCIHKYIQSKINKKDEISNEEKNRSLLVKVIIIKNEEARDKIIKATNFQTAIPPASLKATEKIHRDIEDYFKEYDLFYDRRKNYYKNIGKSANKIISIPLLIQILNTIIKKEPHVSRARPSSLIRNVEIYSQLFNESICPETYLLCAQILKKVTSKFKEPLEDYTSQEKSNLKFHIAMGLVMKILKNKDYSLNDLDLINIQNIPDSLINETISEIISLTRSYRIPKNLSLELSSKSKELTEYLLKHIKFDETPFTNPTPNHH